MRILSRILALLVLTGYAAGQTAAVPALTVQLPGVVLPTQKFSCPVTGKTANCTLQQVTLLKPSQTTTAATSAPVTLPSYTFTLTLTAAQLGTLRTAIASGGGTITGVTVTLKAAQ